MPRHKVSRLHGSSTQVLCYNKYMTDPGGIQLLPETRRALEEKRPNESRLLYISIAIGALIFAAGFGLNYYKNSLYNQVTALNDKFAEIEKGRDKELEA